jgi:hypothetical protein
MRIPVVLAKPEWLQRKKVQGTLAIQSFFTDFHWRGESVFILLWRKLEFELFSYSRGAGR